jgi:hypothetical protein
MRFTCLSQSKSTVYGCQLCSSFSPTCSFIRMRPITYKQKLVRSFNFTSRYIDDVISLKHSKLGDRFVPIKLIIMETTIHEWGNDRTMVAMNETYLWLKLSK